MTDDGAIGCAHFRHPAADPCGLASHLARERSAGCRDPAPLGRSHAAYIPGERKPAPELAGLLPLRLPPELLPLTLALSLLLPPELLPLTLALSLLLPPKPLPLARLRLRLCLRRRMLAGRLRLRLRRVPLDWRLIRGYRLVGTVVFAGICRRLLPDRSRGGRRLLVGSLLLRLLLRRRCLGLRLLLLVLVVAIQTRGGDQQ